ncbi:MAG: glycosyltransferase [Actinobacteria bacterium]|nr:glycosyltransferase [Actinomycetota bacterium]
MRVLHVVSTGRRAGTERHVATLAAALREHGIQAEVACEPGQEGLDGMLEEAGVPVHRLTLRGPGAARSIVPLARLARGFDLIHTHLTHATVMALTATTLVGRPVVETRHFITLAHERRAWPRRVAGKARRRAVDRRLALTLAPSSAVAATVDDRVVRVPHGIPHHTAPLVRLGPLQRFVTVGRLEPDRRVDLAIRAFASAAPRLPDTATLTVVGEGSHRARLMDLSERLGIGPRVRFTGRVDNVTTLLSQADAYLATAVEAFGLATLEAMSAGLPVLGTGEGGVTDLVAHGATGLLVDATPSALAAGLIHLVNAPEQARAWGVEGAHRARRHFSVETMAAGTRDAYTRALAVEPGRPRVLRVYHSGVVSGYRERDRELRRSGADVTLLTPRRWPHGGHHVHLEAGGDDFVAAARTVGRHPALFVYDPRPLLHLLRRHRFDVLDIHEEPHSLSAAQVRLLGRLLQPHAPFLLYTAQNIDKRYPWPFRALERAALRGASAIYPCSIEAGAVLRRKGFTGRLAVLPLGAATRQFTPRTNDDGERTRLRIGYVGSLTEQKGVHVLLRALAELEGSWSLDVVGDGPRRASLRAEAAALGTADLITFHGALPHDSLPARYRSLDVVVVPSLPTPGVREQFCRVAVEAMASGVPVVASRSGALPEVVGDAGVLVPPGDERALRAALRALLTDPERRAELRRRGVLRAQRFDWAQVARMHAALYEEVVGCPSTSSS